MDYTHLLLRYGELFLKGKNQSFFEQALIHNLKKELPEAKVRKVRGRLILLFFKEHQQIKKIFGLVSYSPCLKVGKELELIKKIALELLADKKGSFRIETKRSDKTYPIKSLEVSAQVGRFIEKNSHSDTIKKFSGLSPARLYL